MPSLKQIRYFLAIADQGGFTQAAASLFVAQPALSRQIALLEEKLGFALFEREARGVRLTPAGEMYRDRVLGVERLLEGAAEEGALLARGESGTLRLLHSSSTPVSSLMPWIRQFIAECPRARVDLDRVASEIQVTEIAAGQADVGLVRLPILRREPEVVLVALPPERLWVALPEAHPLACRPELSIVDLEPEAFVSAVHRERGGLARRVTELCLDAGFTPRMAPVISRKTSMLDLVAAGFGVAVIPEGMCATPGSGRVYRPLKALKDEEAVAERAMVLPHRPTPLAQGFARIVQVMTSLP